ncbi:MAG: hypothetical protein J7460_15780 [Chloroflexus sp.]|nr:hypothetical protein [Chloroflexus sp.]
MSLQNDTLAFLAYDLTSSPDDSDLLPMGAAPIMVIVLPPSIPSFPSHRLYQSGQRDGWDDGMDGPMGWMGWTNGRGEKIFRPYRSSPRPAIARRPAPPYQGSGATGLASYPSAPTDGHCAGTTIGGMTRQRISIRSVVQV